jgi:hypothetical protein
MPKRINTKSRKKLANKGKIARGDIPARPIHTYTTISCGLPKVSDSTIVRTLGHSTLTATPTAVAALSLNYSLAQTGLSSSGQWDQYKILAIRVTISPDQTAIGLFTNSTTSYTPLYCVIDYDDSSSLSTVAQAEGYSNCLSLGAGESCERTFRPRMAVAAYTGTFVGFANMADQWIDSANNAILHYGLKMIVPGATAAQTLLPSWQISTEYFIAFRKSV